MRHQVRKKKLNLARGPRQLLMKNLATSLIIHEKIKTTHAKAKVLQSMMEKLVNGAKNPNKAVAIRNVNASLQSELASRKLLESLAKKYQNRESGYTRIVKIGHRSGDAAPMVQIELIA